MKILPENLSQEPSLLIKVTLRGLKPLESWSEEHEEISKTFLDLGGKTKFQFSDPKVVDGKLFVNAEDEEGNDLASLLPECGFPIEERTKGKL